jgi:hypothetical protein
MWESVFDFLDHCFVQIGRPLLVGLDGRLNENLELETNFH